MNIARSVHNVCSTSIVQQAWARGQELAVRGLVYDLHDGLLNDLEITLKNNQEYDDMIARL
jgi:carbonic anhydrase